MHAPLGKVELNTHLNFFFLIRPQLPRHIARVGFLLWNCGGGTCKQILLCAPQELSVVYVIFSGIYYGNNGGEGNHVWTLS